LGRRGCWLAVRLGWKVANMVGMRSVASSVVVFECGRIRAGKEAAGGLVGSGEFGQQWVLGGLGSDGQMVEEGLPLDIETNEC